MSEPKRYPSAPVELPLRMELEPTPVEGCPGCMELANVRDRARSGGDVRRWNGRPCLLVVVDRCSSSSAIVARRTSSGVLSDATETADAARVLCVGVLSEPCRASDLRLAAL